MTGSWAVGWCLGWAGSWDFVHLFFSQATAGTDMEAPNVQVSARRPARHGLRLLLGRGGGTNVEFVGPHAARTHARTTEGRRIYIYIYIPQYPQ
jgi:hypothetical protein